MSVSLRESVGRCDGVESALSVRDHVFEGSTADDLSLRDRLDTPLARGQSVESWLNSHTRVRDAIEWEHTGFLWLFPATTNYRDWSDGEKDQLQDLVEFYAACNMRSLSDPPVNQVTLNDDETARTELSANTARTWYMSHVAHALAVEMGRWVPWSLTDYSDASLRNLLDSRNLYTWRIGDNYEIETAKHGRAIPARPRFTYEFIYENDLIGTTRLDTIARVIDWCRWNLSHFFSHQESPGVFVGGDHTTISMDIHWGYRGLPPVRRVIEGTTRQVTNEFAHWTAGCHGTVGFLRAVLRAVNIPVEYVRRCGHGMPHFLHVNRYLSHGDDPYHQGAKREDLPARDLLVTEATFNAWLGGPFPDCDNVGRGVDEAIADLP